VRIVQTITVTDLKAHLSAWLARVQTGDDVLVTDRGRPVARLVPVAGLDSGDGRLAALCRAGVVRRGTDSLPEGFWSTPRPVVTGRSALDALLKDRDGR